MTVDIIERAVREANYIILHRATVRAAARVFNISKSTIHTDITARLKKIDKKLYDEVHDIMSYHFSVRHILGGEATKKKFLHKRECPVR